FFRPTPFAGAQLVQTTYPSNPTARAYLRALMTCFFTTVLCPGGGRAVRARPVAPAQPGAAAVARIVVYRRRPVQADLGPPGPPSPGGRGVGGEGAFSPLPSGERGEEESRLRLRQGRRTLALRVVERQQLAGPVQHRRLPV